MVRLDTTASAATRSGAHRELLAWKHSYICKLLANRQLVGENQQFKMEFIDDKKKRVEDGAPILDYFPKVVPAELFASVQKILAVNKGKGGQTGKFHNALRGLVKCAYCQGPMNFLDKGSNGKRGGPYLLCENARSRAQCERHKVKYEDLMMLILNGCPLLDPEQVITSEHEALSVISALRDRKREKVDLVADIERRSKNLTEQIEDEDSRELRGPFQTRLKELAADLELQQKELNTLEAELKEAEKNRDNLDDWFQGMGTLLKQIDNQSEEGTEARMKLNSHLKQFIASIEVFPIGYESVSDDAYEESLQWKPAGVKGRASKPKPPLRRRDGIGSMILAIADEVNVKVDRTVTAFIKDIQARRMSKEGRFFRVHFTTGKHIDFAPDESLADGSKLLQESKEVVLFYEESLLNGKLAKEWDLFIKPKESNRPN